MQQSEQTNIQRPTERHLRNELKLMLIQKGCDKSIKDVNETIKWLEEIKERISEQ